MLILSTIVLMLILITIVLMLILITIVLMLILSTIVLMFFWNEKLWISCFSSWIYKFYYNIFST
jgi:hypothetical protein